MRVAVDGREDRRVGKPEIRGQVDHHARAEERGARLG
jgi:hypothetical protein